jgi:hypothetical protein
VLLPDRILLSQNVNGQKELLVMRYLIVAGNVLQVELDIIGDVEQLYQNVIKEDIILLKLHANLQRVQNVISTIDIAIMNVSVGMFNLIITDVKMEPANY